MLGKGGGGLVWLEPPGDKEGKDRVESRKQADVGRGLSLMQRQTLETCKQEVTPSSYIRK